MTNEELKQDFESALLKHLSFKARLRSFLYGNGNEEGPLRDPDQCSLGIWIAERRRGTYAHLAGIRELDAEHRRIHQEANQLMDLHLTGHADEARAQFTAIQNHSDLIVLLLQTLEQAARV